MISVLGNIKLNESNPERVKYLLATLYSLNGISDDINLGMADATAGLHMKVSNLSRDMQSIIHTYSNTNNFQDTQMTMILQLDHSYYLNLEEDHFVACDKEYMDKIESKCVEYGVDIVRASFNEVELKSAEDVDCIYEDDDCKIFHMNQNNFAKFQKHYKRFYIGTNCIFKTEFAKRLYARPGSRPHDYEIGRYSEEFYHTCLVPKRPIMASIDDDHGELKTSLLKKPTEKFTESIKEIEKYL